MPTAPATKLGTSHKSSQATKRKVAKDDDDDESGDEAGSDVEVWVVHGSSALSLAQVLG